MTPGGELAKAALANEWTSPDSSATVLLAVAIDVLSPECLHWEPETIREQLESELGIKILQREMDRFLALRAALISDMAYQDVLVFHHTMNALNGSRIIFSAWDPVDLDELTWGLYELMLNDKPESDDAWKQRFSPDVRRYIGVIANDGHYAPGSLPIIIQTLADFGPVVPDSTEFADDPVIYGEAHGRSVEESRDADDYAHARLQATLQALKTLPFATRSPTWPPPDSVAPADAALR